MTAREAEHQRMEERLTKLETTFDTILPTLATGDDIGLLRMDGAAYRTDVDMLAIRGDLDSLKDSVSLLTAAVYQYTASVHKWMMATILTVILGFGGLFLGLSTIVYTAPVAERLQD